MSQHSPSGPVRYVGGRTREGLVVMFLLGSDDNGGGGVEPFTVLQDGCSCPHILDHNVTVSIVPVNLKYRQNHISPILEGIFTALYFSGPRLDIHRKMHNSSLRIPQRISGLQSIYFLPDKTFELRPALLLRSEREREVEIISQNSHQRRASHRERRTPDWSPDPR